MIASSRLGVAALVCLAGSFASATPVAKTAKEIMTQLNKGANAPLIVMKRDLQKDNPDWSEIQGQTKEYAKLIGDLKDAKAPKGEAASWTKLCKEYSDAAKALNDAAQQKDKSAALAAHTKMTRACAACHKTHRD